MEAACAPSSHLELVLLLLPVEVLKQNQAGLHGGLTDAKGAQLCWRYGAAGPKGVEGLAGAGFSIALQLLCRVKAPASRLSSCSEETRGSRWRRRSERGKALLFTQPSHRPCSSLPVVLNSTMLVSSRITSCLCSVLQNTFLWLLFV